MPSEAAKQCCNRLYWPAGNPDLANATRVIAPGSSGLSSKYLRAKVTEKERKRKTPGFRTGGFPVPAAAESRQARQVASDARARAEASAL